MTKEERNRLKVVILEAGLDRDVSCARRESFRYRDNTNIKKLREDHPYTFKIAEGINNARQHRKRRVSKRIDFYVKLGYCHFLTLTFTDEVLKATNAETRRKYVRRFLKKNSPCYVANIDYGNDGVKKAYFDDNGVLHESTAREHYHALIFADRIDYKPWHKYGAIKDERVRKTENDQKRVSAYVAKLSNHAMKLNDGIAPRFIYSRDKQAIRKCIAEAF